MKLTQQGMRRATGVLLVVCLVAACARRGVDATAEGVVRAFIERIEQSGEDPASRKAAFELLGPKSRANLETRALRLSQVLGRPVSPHEVLAQGWVFQRFAPKIVTSIGGGLVRITGEHPETDRAEFQCVKDGDVFRVELALPEPPAVLDANSPMR